jgi:hypothetical protein
MKAICVSEFGGPEVLKHAEDAGLAALHLDGVIQ